MPSDENGKPRPPTREEFDMALEIAETVLQAALIVVKEERQQKQKTHLPEGPGSFIPQGELK